MNVMRVEDATRALQQCNRLLLRKPPAGEEAWRIVEPFLKCTEFEGRCLIGNSELLQMLHTVAGDAKVEMGCPREAAAHFRNALTHRGPFGFAARYASIVLKHNISDHVSTALEAIDRSEHQWSSHSFLYRSFSRVLWFLFFVIPHPYIWREYKQMEADKETLRRMGNSTGAASD